MPFALLAQAEPGAGAVILLCMFGMTALFVMFVVITSIRIVPEYQRLRVYRLGRLLGDRGPGLVMLMPFIDRAERIDLAGAGGGLAPGARLVGQVGEARTHLSLEGAVYVSGQVWEARSQRPIAAGAKVRVVRQILEVEAM
jgi:membrane protein implicated in regulation of membrane protease activity